MTTDREAAFQALRKFDEDHPDEVILDPLPWRHSCWDDGTCDAIGERHETKEINDDFRPREGYSQNREDYQ